MTTADYARTAATVDRLIGKYGATATIVRNTAGAYDPATASATVTAVSAACKMAVFDYPHRFADGTHIRMGDLQAYMSVADQTVPKAGDGAIWQGTAYKVISVKNLAPAGEAVLYELQLRK